VQREIRVPDGKDAVMETMKPPGRDRTTNRGVRITESLELPNRDNAMLSVGQSGQPLIPRQRFCVHSGNKLCRG